MAMAKAIRITKRLRIKFLPGNKTISSDSLVRQAVHTDVPVTIAGRSAHEGDYAMSSLLHLTRRSLVKLGLGSAAIAPLSQVLTASALAPGAGPDSGTVGAVGRRAESELFLGEGMA